MAKMLVHSGETLWPMGLLVSGRAVLEAISFGLKVNLFCIKVFKALFPDLRIQASFTVLQQLLFSFQFYSYFNCKENGPLLQVLICSLYEIQICLCTCFF